jgi:tRNA threonylcarbamoyladenosine biosynthesis protein TsaE
MTRGGVDATTASVLVPDADATRQLGRRLAALCRAGDVIILAGELGAGKTTFVQGLAAGLGVRGAVTSPTFVISRLHASAPGGLALVHVDAYRVGDGAELDDLDLDAYTDQAVTVVEWGDGVAEALSPHRLRVQLARDVTDPAPGVHAQASPSGGSATKSCGGELDEAAEWRRVTVTPTGSRWTGVPLRATLAQAAVPRPGGGRDDAGRSDGFAGGR